MQDFEKETLIGIVFDLSFSNKNGEKNLEKIKEILYKEILEKQIRIYVSHPSLPNLAKDEGENTYFIVSYTEPPNFSIGNALKQAVSVVGESSDDFDKYVFLFTDRFYAPHNYHYKKAFLLNNIRGYESKIIVFGIGESYDKSNLQSMTEEYNSKLLHLDDSSFFSGKISEILGH
jgi:hypothetical protein